MIKQSNKQKLSDREVERAGIRTPIIYSYTPHSHYDSIKNDLSIDDKPKFAEKNKKVKVWMGPNWTFDSVRSREALYFNNGESFCRVRGLINKMRKKVKVKFGRKKKKGDYYCPI